MPDTIRMAADDDFDAIASITNHFIRTTAIHFGERESTAAELRTLWQRHHELYPWLVLTRDDACIGFAKAGVWRDRAAYRWTPEVGIYLRPDCTGQGLGRGLYARLIAVLQAQGFRSLMAGATLPNPASERLHEGLGFTPVGIVRDAGWKFGRWHDVIFWQLRLRSDDRAGGEMLSPPAAFAATARRRRGDIMMSYK